MRPSAPPTLFLVLTLVIVLSATLAAVAVPQKRAPADDGIYVAYALADETEYLVTADGRIVGSVNYYAVTTKPGIIYARPLPDNSGTIVRIDYDKRVGYADENGVHITYSNWSRLFEVEKGARVLFGK